MKRYKNQLIAAAVLSVLAVIGTIMNSRQASAQGGGPRVTIESPIPLPITGSTTILGTPNVSVTNPPASPVFTRDVDDAARNAVQFELFNRVNGGVSYTVPAGKILVIEECSSNNTLSGAFGVATTVKGNDEVHWIPVFPGGSGYVGGRTTRIYASPGTTVIHQSSGVFGPNPELKCSGHLVSEN
jgi:hypothetical protein